jgi:hypothetical protein
MSQKTEVEALNKEPPSDQEKQDPPAIEEELAPLGLEEMEFFANA